MFSLFILLLQRLGIILVLAFLLVNVSFFRKLIAQKSLKAGIALIAIFTIFTIISNLTGVEITRNNSLVQAPFLTGLPQSDSIANTRTLVITVAGIIGGPLVGSVVGFLGGLHRVIQGNFSDYFYIVSSTLVGLVSGLLAKKLKHNTSYPSPGMSAALGLLAESLQMIFIGIFSGLALVKLIIIPMILLNSIGVSVFISILNAYLSNEQQLKAVQTHDVLNLTNRTLPYFRQGLNINSAQQACRIIRQYTNFDAVGITDRVNVLAHVGAGEDHHLAGQAVLTDLSKHVIASGTARFAYHQAEIGCPHAGCPLASAIVLPLIVNDKTIGALKMYFTKAERLTSVEENLAQGLASIFSSQLALGMAEEQSKLASDAEIKSLQAQINPHFFFNAINTVSALMRTNVDQARTALLQLSTFFRSSLQGVTETQIPLKQEKEHVNSYMSLEQTRFPDKYTVIYAIDAAPEVQVPPFCLQVLVENSVRHAFPNRRKGNIIKITVKQHPTALNIIVADNGIGIKKELLARLGQETITSSTGTGTALANLNRRLIGLYGNESHLQIKSSAAGTTIKIVIPNL
ncbi:sensor histidine kinase [Liquorilactobacillus satsumensis]|uniref:sensor histidine kinase n=1 Tax=Liquorilactobacillus satsumensis TaxID=259059 RepID=UPI001E42948B|nr:sensor histidine kinase [Liquorilactobacillus satsumensis]MCC7666428.1 sensor protein LytS [Liquorilactobacillus satsumensis]MCP9312992.1 sensor histidine kinase [Liquorilactobacillus satsumensis]MCP9357647.1 sensor histidine kinase [Liquorilactobacillus satsumensis]MCP9360148.1 sensor histidine kinase [Liquorilactobacillus satsumensis]MCP9371387.1 sensor histidine kinase [Liquorilactobacillus satsumensis]